MTDPAESGPLKRVFSFNSADVAPNRVAIRRIADQTRGLIDHLVRTAAPDDVVSGIADEIAAIVARLDAQPVREGWSGFSESANSGDPHVFFDDSPLLGLSNPIAPPIRLDMHEDHVVGNVTFGKAYEGPPGCVHGGFIAAAFDEVLGTAQSLSGSPGMTGRLVVNYRSPTPLGEPLRFVGRLDRIEGRKIYTVGQSFHGDTLTAEAEGLFISIDFAKFAEARRATTAPE